MKYTLCRAFFSALLLALTFPTPASAIYGFQDESEAKNFKTIRSLVEKSTVSINFAFFPSKVEESDDQKENEPVILATFCSGTLISADTVITAAHCLNLKKGSTQLMEKKLEELLAIGFHDRKSYYPVKEVRKHPKNYQEQRTFGVLAKNDLAIIKLAKPIENFEPIVKLNREAIPKEEAIPAYIAGYGISEGPSLAEMIQAYIAGDKNTSAGKGDNGILRMARTMVQERPHLFSGEVSIGIVDDTKTICQGDSGGPVFLLKKGVLYLAGVHSTGSCQLGKANSVPVNYHLPWIEKNL